MQAKNVMAHAVVVRADEMLDVAVRRMWDHDVGGAVVVRIDGAAIGMVTDRDASMAALHQGRALHDLPVALAMSAHLISVGPDDDIARVEELMTAHQISRVPVTDAAGMVLGMVGLADLARMYLRGHRHAPSHGPLAMATLAAGCGDHRPRRYAA